jgi:murein DD-endopeptidase MepM/ murein hydrolase activator NlpD
MDAGEVIGYLGMTGYSTKEDTNNINVPHLHVGLQIILDTSQKDGVKQIWLDMYELTNFLAKNRAEVAYDKETKEHYSKNSIIDLSSPD